MEQESEGKPGLRHQLLQGGFVCFLHHRLRRKGLLEPVGKDVVGFYMGGFVVVGILEEGGRFVF